MNVGLTYNTRINKLLNKQVTRAKPRRCQLQNNKINITAIINNHATESISTKIPDLLCIKFF